MNKLVNVEELAKFFDVSKATVNYYTNIGLIEVKDIKRNRRLYDRDQVGRRINKVKEMMKMGYTIKLILRELSAGNITDEDSSS